MCLHRITLDSRINDFLHFKNINKINDASPCFFLSCVWTENHPIEYAIDGTNRWWQSPSIKNGMEYHYVTITLDLKQVDTLRGTHNHTPFTPILNSYAS